MLKSVGPIVAGSVSMLLGIIILGAMMGFIPMSRASLLAPPAILLAIGSGLMFLGAVIWIPRDSPAWIRAGLGLALLVTLGVVCNWTAFAPEVRYISNLQLGPWVSAREDPIGGRIVFGLAALVVDLFLLGSLLWAVREGIRAIRR